MRFVSDILIKRRPIHLTLFVTRRCNARCPFCFYLQDTNLCNENVDEMSLEEYQKLSASLGDLLWLSISGGEPFLRKDLAEICRTFYKNNRPSIILIPTNGIATDKIEQTTREILEDCPKSVITVKLSIDGPPALHDSIRGFSGAFDAVMRTYEALKGLPVRHKNFELGINTVFCRDNQDVMDDVIGIVASMKGIRTHTISLARGDIGNGDMKDVDLSKYESAINRLKDMLHKGETPVYSFKGARIKAAQDVIQRQLIHRTASTNTRQLPCYAGRINLVATESGALYPCENFNASFLLGNLRDFNCDASKLLAAGQAGDIIDRIGRECFCTHECFMMTNILFNPALYPRLLVETLRLHKV